MLQPCSGSSNSSSSSSSFLFPMSGSMDEPASYYYSSSTSVVDCTLSLGTPSSRHAGAAASPMNRPTYSSSPSLCWDIVTQSKTQQQAAAASRVPSASSICNSNSNSSNMGGGGDPLLLARRCANCDTTSTPLWRNGPRGPKSLCNACGIRYKKEERRAAVSTAPPSLNEPTNSTYRHHHQQQYPWSCYPSAGTSPKSTAGLSWCQSDEDMEASPYLSWRLSVVPHFPVTDRPSLFQYQ